MHSSETPQDVFPCMVSLSHSLLRMPPESQTTRRYSLYGSAHLSLSFCFCCFLLLAVLWMGNEWGETTSSVNRHDRQSYRPNENKRAKTLSYFCIFLEQCHITPKFINHTLFEVSKSVRGILTVIDGIGFHFRTLIDRIGVTLPSLSSSRLTSRRSHCTSGVNRSLPCQIRLTKTTLSELALSLNQLITICILRSSTVVQVLRYLGDIERY